MRFLIVLFTILSFVPQMTAQAAQKPINLLPQLGQPLFPKAATPTPAPAPSVDPLNQLMQQLDKVQAEVVADVVADIQAADADAGAIVTPATDTAPAVVKDPLAHACYPAAIQFLQSLPVAKPLTGKLTGVQLFQRKRDFVAQLQAGLPTYIKLGCMPLLGDEINTAVSLLGMVGVKILPAALTAAVPGLAPITLPALALTP